MSYISENLHKLMFREMEPPKKTLYISGVNFLVPWKSNFLVPWKYNISAYIISPCLSQALKFFYIFSKNKVFLIFQEET